MSTLAYGLTAVTLLLVSAFLSGSETAVFSLSPDQRQRLCSAPGARGRAAARLLAHPSRLLMTLLLGNLLANLLFYSLAAGSALQLERDGHAWSALALSAASVLVLVVLGEVIPKTVCRAGAEMVSGSIVVPIWGLCAVLYPLVWGMSRITDAMTHRLVGPPRQLSEQREDFEHLVDLSREKGVIGEEQRRFLHEILEFSTLKVRDVTVPRVDIAAIDLDGGREEALQEIRTHKVSRLVAYKGDLDKVSGQLIAHQVVLHADRSLGDLVLPIPAVPEQATAEAALSLLDRSKSPIALVVDEFGGTAGIVASKDLLGEIVGETGDEHLRPGRRVVERSAEDFLVAGWTMLREWREKTGAPEVDEAASTVGGLVVRRLDRPPEVGDEVETEWFRYRIRRVRRGRVLLLEARRLQDPPARRSEA